MRDAACHRTRGFLIVVALQALAIGPVYGLDKTKVADANARRATVALEQGDHEQAARLFHEAFKLDPAHSEYLYGAARETLSAGKMTSAEELFRTFLALPDIDPARAAKAKGYVRELRANAKAQEADAARARGDGALAASLYREAATLDPSKPVYRLRAARASQDVGQNADSVESLRAFLATAPPTDPDRPEAETRLKALTNPTPVKNPQPSVSAVAAGAPASAAKAAPVAVVTMAPRSTGGGRTAGIVTTVIGAAVLATGAVVWGLARSDEAAYEASIAASAADGKIHGTTYDAAAAARQAVANKQMVGQVLVGVGGAAALAGAIVWAIADKPSPVTVAPTLSGMQMAWQF